MKTPRTLEKHQDIDVPVRVFEHPGVTIQGFSRAAFLSYWRIPELKIGFDLGAHPAVFANTDCWALSHTHVDHIAGLPSYLARRDILGMKPPRIFLPAEKVDQVRAVLKAWALVQEYELPCELIGMSPGQRMHLRNDLWLSCFRTDHTIVSCGYVVWQDRQKLRPEYRDLSSDRIEDLRKSGGDVTELSSIPVIAYTGDTRISTLQHVPEALSARVLITESTFLRNDAERSRASEYGHIHMSELAAMADRFQNELIVLAHFSSVYSAEEIKKAAGHILPAALRDRVVLWI
jgi:ribonuclease Z